MKIKPGKRYIARIEGPGGKVWEDTIEVVEQIEQGSFLGAYSAKVVKTGMPGIWYGDEIVQEV